MSESKPRSIFANRVFTRLWATVEISFLGPFVHVVACAWLIAGMTDSATMVALTQTANALPLVIFSLFAGALADTHDQRWTMIAALGLSVLGSAMLAAFAWFDLLGPWSMLALLFTVGVGVAIFTPSWQASLGALVEREQLGEAVSLHNMGANLMRTIGPTLGGVLVTFAGATVTFLVGALSYLPALLMLSLWRPQKPVQDHVIEREPLTRAMASGLRFLLASQDLMPILLRVFCFSSSAISVMALLPLIARDQLSGDAASYGILFGAFGGGAILGGLLIRVWRRRHSNETVVRAAFLINALALVALALSRTFAMGLTATLVAGGCWLTVHSLQNTTLQLATPRWIVGRMVSLFLTAAFLGLSVGSWLWGLMAELTGTEIALAASALTMAGTWILARRFPLPETRNLIVEPLPQSHMPTQLPEGGNRSGTVQIMVEHHIGADKETEFHRLMFLRRRHFTRIGARHWTLLSPLDRSGSWIETFQLASWADFERYMNRRTAETLSLRAEVAAVQENAAPPVVRHYLAVAPGPKPSTVMLRT